MVSCHGVIEVDFSFLVASIPQDLESSADNRKVRCEGDQSATLGCYDGCWARRSGVPAEHNYRI